MANNVALPDAPNVYEQRIDKSGFVTGGSSLVVGVCFYSLQGPLTPTYFDTVDSLDSTLGRPDPTVSYAHYGMRHIINSGYSVYGRRVVNGATYGGQAVLSNAAANTVTADPYPVAGSPFPADPDPTSGIAPTGPGYISLVFNGPLVTGNVVNMNIVMDSAVVAITPVTYSGSSDATMNAVAAAIETAMAGAGSGGKATVIDSDPTNTANARVIGVFAPTGQVIAITDVTVTSGTTQATVTQQTPLFYVQAENPGAWSRGAGYKLTNADVGTRQVINMTFAAAVGAVASITVTINGVACNAVNNLTPSDAFLAAVATEIEAHPDVMSASVVKRPMGEANDRVITITMLRGDSTPADISHVVTGAVPAITYTTIVPGVSPTGAFDLEVYTRVNPTIPLERHRVAIAQQIDVAGNQQQIAYVVNQGATKSSIIRVINSAPTDGSVVIPFDPVTGNITNGITWLSAGDNGALPTGAQIAEAYKDFEKPVYSIGALASMGYTAASVQQSMCAVAELRNDGTQAILDVPSAYQSFAAIGNYRMQDMPIDTAYGAIYMPDVQQQDPYTGMMLWVPPSAHEAVVYANNDSIRGIGGAPAGLRVGQVNTSKVRHEYTDEQYNFIFGKLKINLIRKEGFGYFCMGDTTSQARDSALSFVSVNRLTGFLQAAIRRFAKQYLFEKNNDVTMFSFLEACKRYLDPWKASGDLNDYQFVSSAANNTAGVIEQGNRIVDMILDPGRSIRRILVRTTITATGGIKSIEVSEL